ncbi:MAG: HNH endonuclease [Eggerthellaceae bacterium]|nr:HNH endonuclease [Eggerthellaceae bacterium]
MRRKQNKTAIREIVEYWSGIVDECDLSVDWAEAEERCWRCGSVKELTRCHIVPHSLGGNDEPSNYVVLCRQCHEEGPNVSEPEIMWDWLMAYSCSLYDTFWRIEGEHEYARIYQRTVNDDLLFLKEHGEISDEEIEAAITEAFCSSTKHFGQTMPNKATTAGIFRIMLKDLADSRGVSLLDMRRPSLTRRRNPGFANLGNDKSRS